LLFQNLRRYTRTVDCLIAPSPGMQAVMRSWGLPEPIVVIPNGIYLQPFFDPPNTLRRKDLGLAEDDFVWVFVGRVSPEKNLLFLLDAFHQALSDNPHMSLLIVGDGPLIPALTQIVADLHLEQKIVFAGLVEYEQLPAYLRLANAFATASQTEVHPLTLIEAIASGLPVVGIRSPGVADIVVHGVNGYLCEPDLEEFADKMVALSTQTDQYHSRSQAARQSAQQYSIEHTTDSLVTLYEQTIQARKRDRSRI
jgi:glycosyltransferase involved in cell wall biosynthesis